MHTQGWLAKRPSIICTAPGRSFTEFHGQRVDRYIAWPVPGARIQIGQLKILELPHAAEKDLGPKFDSDVSRLRAATELSRSISWKAVREWISQYHNPHQRGFVAPASRRRFSRHAKVRKPRETPARQMLRPRQTSCFSSTLSNHR